MNPFLFACLAVTTLAVADCRRHDPVKEVDLNPVAAENYDCSERINAAWKSGFIAGENDNIETEISGIADQLKTLEARLEQPAPTPCQCRHRKCKRSCK